MPEAIELSVARSTAEETSVWGVSNGYRRSEPAAHLVCFFCEAPLRVTPGAAGAQAT